MIMKKSEKWKTIFKSKSLIYIVIAFAVAPVAINLGLVFSNIIFTERRPGRKGKCRKSMCRFGKGIRIQEYRRYPSEEGSLGKGSTGYCGQGISANTGGSVKSGGFLQQEG